MYTVSVKELKRFEDMPKSVADSLTEAGKPLRDFCFTALNMNAHVNKWTSKIENAHEYSEMRGYERRLKRYEERRVDAVNTLNAYIKGIDEETYIFLDDCSVDGMGVPFEQEEN